MSEHENPSMYGAKPVHGNYTDAASMHLWCAEALSCLLSTPADPVENLNDHLQEALRYLLMSEIGRAKCAQAAGHD